MKLIFCICFLIGSPQIVFATDGKKIPITRVPWQVSLQMEDRLSLEDGSIVKGKHLCGGSLIGRKWVLTAAHCVDWLNPKEKPYQQIRVRAGSENQAELFSLPRIKAVFIHPEYYQKDHYLFPSARVGFLFEELRNDIALIELASEVTLSDRIQLIALDGPELQIGDPLFVSGWSDQKQDTAIDPWLNGFSSNYETNETLFDKTKDIAPLMAEHFHQSDTMGVLEKLAACAGDSGGPMVRMPKSQAESPLLVGVLSMGIDDCEPDEEMSITLATKVSDFREWIYQVVNNNF